MACGREGVSAGRHGQRAFAMPGYRPTRGREDQEVDRQEFQPSTLSRDQQLEEMKWFPDAAEPFRGMDINVVSETIDTHVYESQTLAKAFRRSRAST